MSFAAHPSAPLTEAGVPVLATLPAAALTALATALFTTPLDVMAIRAQLAQPGVKWMDHVPSLWRGGLYNVARVPLFALARAGFLSAYLFAVGGEPSVQGLVLAGATSHVVGVVATHPLDSLKTARVACVPRGPLWAGVGPAVAAAMVAEAAGAGVYGLSTWPVKSPWNAQLMPPTVWGSIVAGLAVTAATHPFDTVKRRMQAGERLSQAAGRALYQGLTHAGSRTVGLVCGQIIFYEPLLHFTAWWLRVRTNPQYE